MSGPVIAPATTSNAGVTSFVGRRRELAEAKARMQESRLVTLTGPGGVGKTRLAAEVGHRSRKAFRDGVWTVELASLDDASGVASAVGTALALPDQSNRASLDRLTGYLQDKQLLLVLDNCEHLLEPLAELAARLLRAAPGLRVLATSREPLGIAGEYICVIPPLSVPSTEDGGGQQPLEHFESVQLLLDRARGVVPDFAVTEDNRAAIVQLCSTLDGMPLAIELAATRLRTLSVTQLVERLDQRFQLLTGGDRTALPRQQTLRALIDWSYELCTTAEKLLWKRLSVFPGSFDLHAVEEVCIFGDLEHELAVDVLDHLVAKSIVLTERSGEGVRYRLLMTIREYGAQLLEDSGRYVELRRRHRDHYLRRADDMVRRWCGPGQAASLQDCLRDHPNLLSALEWSVQTPGEHRPGARLAAALRYHWIAGGFLSDGRYWLDRILRQMQGASPERGTALWVAAWVCLIQGDRDAAAQYLRECEHVADVLQDPALQAHARHWSALHSLFSGDLPQAIQLFHDALEIFRQRGDTASELTALFQLAMAQRFDGAPREALATCDVALQLSISHGELWTRAYSLWVTGLCHWNLGQKDQAKSAATQALELQRDFRDGICTALTIELMSWIAVSNSSFANAKKLADAAASVWHGLGTSIEAFGPHIHAESVAAAKQTAAGLGRSSPKRPAQPASISKEEAIAAALGVAASRKAPEAKSSPLTKKESEIAALIAQGMTNRSMAEALVVSPRTVDGHVERILAKLQFTSRAQIAAWVANNSA
jgi:predicted ATPase/DNA-binding CsgD family transcriptional regulator